MNGAMFSFPHFTFYCVIIYLFTPIKGGMPKLWVMNSVYRQQQCIIKSQNLVNVGSQIR